MANSRFDDARRRLDEALGQLDQPLASEAGPAALPEPPAGAAPALSEVLTRLAVGSAVLGLDALATRAEGWERAAGMPSRSEAAGAPDDLHFRAGLIGWIFETEEELRPHGNPLQWSRTVVGYLFNTVFSVVLDALPLPGVVRRQAEGGPVEQETTRWVTRGQLEEQRSRAFAAVALQEMLNQAIPYLARQPGVQQAIAELVRSPAMDDAIVTLARREGVQEAVIELMRSPAIEEAIDHLAHSPALVDLVQAQGSTIAGEIADEVRERGADGDAALERLARRLLGRPPRTQLPPDEQGLLVTERLRRK